MASDFSNDGTLYAALGQEGKLRIWETSTSKLKQEFLPSAHLSQPCRCLQWLKLSSDPWRKNKGSSNSKTNLQCIALGTTGGSIIIYSPSESKICTQLERPEGSGTPVDCLTWADHTGLFSCSDSYIIRWDLREGSVKCKWKDYKNENASCAMVVPGKYHLITAARSIKLWDIDSQELLRKFVGHAFNVHLLRYIAPSPKMLHGYFISGAKSDRFLNCWSLNMLMSELTTVAKFLMEDIPNDMSVVIDDDGAMKMAATVRSGVVHVYEQTLNGKCEKPVKPKLTLQVASENAQTRNVVQVPILTSHMNPDGTVAVGYGAKHIMIFENVVLSTFEKLQCLVRIDPRILKIKEKPVSKNKTPETEKDVVYLVPSNTTVKAAKRKIGNDNIEVPMEKRLENLLLSKPNSVGIVPKADNVANLLIQGLHSKDKQILQNVFMQKDEATIRNTVQRMPLQILTVLIQELTTLIQGKTVWSQYGAVWLKHVVQLHASQLIADPSLGELVGPTLGAIQHRLTLLAPLSRLRGRLDLIVSQISTSVEDPIEQTALVYQDQDSSDSSSEDNLDMTAASDSDDQWDENSSNDSSHISDVEMS